jgi:2'-5' RNA ligase
VGCPRKYTPASERDWSPARNRASPGGSRASRVTTTCAWVGVGLGRESLVELPGRVEAALAPLGFPAERRPFAGHLTLARVRAPADRATRERLWRALEPCGSLGTLVVGRFDPARVRPFPAFRVTSVSLIASPLTSGGAVYRTLEAFALT